MLHAVACGQRGHTNLKSNGPRHVPDLFYSGAMATGRPFDLPYMVEQWDDTDSHIEEIIALRAIIALRVLHMRKQSSSGQGGS